MAVRMAFDPAGDDGGPARANRGPAPALARGPRIGVFFL
jgi:hypothetical protein